MVLRLPAGADGLGDSWDAGAGSSDGTSGAKRLARTGVSVPTLERGESAAGVTGGEDVGGVVPKSWRDGERGV
jgi:hypothetical protein